MRRPPSFPVRRLAASLAVAVALSGCGGGGSASSSGSSSAASTTTATATTPATTTLPGANRPPVTIGDKNFTEQFVLGELYDQALTAKGFAVTLDRNIGPTSVTQKALASGGLGMYPEYLGTWDTTVAGVQRRFMTVRGAYEAGQQYAEAHGLELLHPTPFSDVDAIGVTATYARQNGLRTIADLAKVVSTLTIGAPPQFQRATAGLPGMEQLYRIVPAAFKSIAIGDQYQALDSGSVQAADVSTTDGQLLSGQYTLLADPKRLFGWGNVVPIVTTKVLVAEGPAFATTIDTVSALLSTDVIRQLNADVDVDHQDPAAVAKEFLVTHGLESAG